MATIKLDVVTAEGVVFSDDVELVVALATEGELGILPHHTPLMAILQPGELRVRKGGEDAYLAVSGGFLEVRPDRVIVLADTAERAEEIDRQRAEDAKKRAEELLSHPAPEVDLSRAEAEAALRRSITRLKVVERRRKRTTPQ